MQMSQTVIFNFLIVLKVAYAILTCHLLHLLTFSYMEILSSLH